MAHPIGVGGCGSVGCGVPASEGIAGVGEGVRRQVRRGVRGDGLAGHRPRPAVRVERDGVLVGGPFRVDRLVRGDRNSRACRDLQAVAPGPRPPTVKGVAGTGCGRQSPVGGTIGRRQAGRGRSRAALAVEGHGVAVDRPLCVERDTRGAHGVARPVCVAGARAIGGRVPAGECVAGPRERIACQARALALTYHLGGHRSAPTIGIEGNGEGTCGKLQHGEGKPLGVHFASFSDGGGKRERRIAARIGRPGNDTRGGDGRTAGYPADRRAPHAVRR